MDWNNRVTELLGSRYPIMQAAYQGFGTSTIAAPVSEAGAFGFITAHCFRSPEKLREDIRSARAMTNRPFGVNFSVVQTTAEVIRDEHMIANGCFPEVEGADGMRTIDSPIQVQAEGIEKVKPQNPPAIGEHTMSELKAVGFSEDDIKAMAEAKAVGLPKGAALDMRLMGRERNLFGRVELIEYVGLGGTDRFGLAKPPATGALHIGFAVPSIGALTEAAPGIEAHDFGAVDLIYGRGRVAALRSPAGLRIELFESSTATGPI